MPSILLLNMMTSGVLHGERSKRLAPPRNTKDRTRLQSTGVQATYAKVRKKYQQVPLWVCGQRNRTYTGFSVGTGACLSKYVFHCLYRYELHEFAATHASFRKDLDKCKCLHTEDNHHAFAAMAYCMT